MEAAETPSRFLFFWGLYCSDLQVPRESLALGAGTWVVPSPKGCRRIQLLNGMSFGDRREGGDEVSSTRSWPPPHRNRRAVTTSGFSVPACANDVLDAGLALSLSPDDTYCAPLAALNMGTMQSRDREVGIRVSGALV